jgi:hypothetical protein
MSEFNDETNGDNDTVTAVSNFSDEAVPKRLRTEPINDQSNEMNAFFFGSSSSTSSLSSSVGDASSNTQGNHGVSSQANLHFKQNLWNVLVVKMPLTPPSAIQGRAIASSQDDTEGVVSTSTNEPVSSTLAKVDAEFLVIGVILTNITRTLPEETFLKGTSKTGLEILTAAGKKHNPPQFVKLSTPRFENCGWVTPNQSLMAIKHASIAASSHFQSSTFDTIKVPSATLQMLPLNMFKRQMVIDDGILKLYDLPSNPANLEIINGFVYGNAPPEQTLTSAKAMSRALFGQEYIILFMYYLLFIY